MAVELSRPADGRETNSRLAPRARRTQLRNYFDAVGGVGGCPLLLSVGCAWIQRRTCENLRKSTFHPSGICQSPTPRGGRVTMTTESGKNGATTLSRVNFSFVHFLFVRAAIK